MLYKLTNIISQKKIYIILVLIPLAFVFINGCAPIQNGNQSSSADSVISTVVMMTVQAMPTSTPTPTLVPTPTDSPTPTTTPTSMGGGSGKYLLGFGQNSIGPVGYRIVDDDGNTILEDNSKSAIAISNDGTRYAQIVEGGVAIFSIDTGPDVYDLAGVSPSSGVGGIYWLPGENKVVLSYHPGGFDGIYSYTFSYYLIDLQSRSHQVLIDNGLMTYILASSPDGNLLAMTASDQSDFLLALDGSNRRFSPPTSNLQQGHYYKFLGWNYDSSATYWLNYSAWYGENHELLRMNMSDWTLTAYGEDPNFNPQCVPSKIEEMLYCGNSSYVIHADSVEHFGGNNSEYIKSDQEFLRKVIPSPDESKILAIYETSSSEKRLGIIFNTADQTSHKLKYWVTEIIGGWSPDGKLMYGFKDSTANVVVVFDPETQAVIKEFSSPSNEYIYQLAWIK